MAGQAVVTIKDKRWSASVANTYVELTTGLSGVSSMPPQTGMLFDLGYDQKYIEINMSQMLFPLDIIFINSTQGVVGALHNVKPGEKAYLSNETYPGARCFLEVNAGEAQGIEVGANVAIEGYAQTATQFDIGSLINIMVIMMVVVGMTKIVGKMLAPPKERRLLPQTTLERQHSSTPHLPQTAAKRYEFFPERVRKRLPPIGSTGEEKDPMAWVKFFTPSANWTWYAMEFNGKDIFFGWVVGIEKEFGSFSLSELQSLKGPAGLKVERDIYFEPKPISKVMKEEGEYLAATKEVPAPTILPAVSPPEGPYSWMITDPETGEIMIKEGYSTIARARESARAFAIQRAKYAGEHPVNLSIDDRPPDIADLKKGVVFEGRIVFPVGRIVELTEADRVKTREAEIEAEASKWLTRDEIIKIAEEAAAKKGYATYEDFAQAIAAKKERWQREWGEKMKTPRVVPIKEAERKPPGGLEYLADSPEFLAQTIEAIGYRDKLDSAFQEAIARAKRRG